MNSILLHRAVYSALEVLDVDCVIVACKGVIYVKLFTYEYPDIYDLMKVQASGIKLQYGSNRISKRIAQSLPDIMALVGRDTL